MISPAVAKQIERIEPITLASAVGTVIDSAASRHTAAASPVCSLTEFGVSADDIDSLRRNPASNSTT